MFGVGRGSGQGQQQQGQENSSSGPSTSSLGATKIQPGQIRLQTEISELELPPGCSIDFPDPKDLMKFIVSIRPDEGFWREAKYRFSFAMKPLYPHEPPKVKCETLIYHPNIDLDGNVCLNILREDWKPILSISAVIYGLLHLLLEPNPNDPLNQEAAEILKNNKPEFSRIVMRTLRGGTHQERVFPRLI